MLLFFLLIGCVAAARKVAKTAADADADKPAAAEHFQTPKDKKLIELRNTVRPFFKRLEHQAMTVPDYQYPAHLQEVLSSIRNKSHAIATNNSITTTTRGFGFLMEALGLQPRRPPRPQRGHASSILDYVTLSPGQRSYILDKQDIYLCLRDEEGEYYKSNYLVYVILHEVTHFILEHEIGHSDYFYTVFDQLLQEAVRQNIYDPADPVPGDYCKH